jgi:hypothetical protein
VVCGDEGDAFDGGAPAVGWGLGGVVSCGVAAGAGVDGVGISLRWVGDSGPAWGCTSNARDVMAVKATAVAARDAGSGVSARRRST